MSLQMTYIIISSILILHIQKLNAFWSILLNLFTQNFQKLALLKKNSFFYAYQEILVFSWFEKMKYAKVKHEMTLAAYFKVIMSTGNSAKWFVHYRKMPKKKRLYSSLRVFFAFLYKYFELHSKFSEVNFIIGKSETAKKKAKIYSCDIFFLN